MLSRLTYRLRAEVRPLGQRPSFTSYYTSDIITDVRYMLGQLPKAVFARICLGAEEGVTGLYAGEALTYYASTLGLDEVTSREVQSAIDVLKASNLIMRNGDRGPVTVTDPFVRESWLRLHTKGESVVDQSSMLELDDDKSL